MNRNSAWVILSVAFVAVWWANSLPPVKRTAKTTVSEASCNEVPISSGVYQDFSAHEAIAPLRVVTTSKNSYFVKLADYNSHQTVMTFFVYGGIPEEVLVPLGTYSLRYAYGNKWCGESQLFGDNTQYGEADSKFEFRNNGGSVSGYTVELIERQHGNLRTKSIPANSF